MESGVIQLQDLFRFKRIGTDQNGKVKGEYQATGVLPSFYNDFMDIGKPMSIELFRNTETE